MKEDRLIFHGCFDEPLEVITDLVGRYLDELVKVRPQVVLEVKVTDDKWLNSSLTTNNRK